MQQLNQEPEPLKVSSREFVEAIADIEAKANARPADELLSIEEALTSIGMDIPPEEVMSVIREKRAQAAQMSSAKQVRKQKLAKRAGLYLVCFSVFANFVFFVALNRMRAPQTVSDLSLPAATEIVQSMPPTPTPVVASETAPAINSATEMEDGVVHIVPGKTGVVKFARYFAHPPNVEITGLGSSKTRIVEITKDGFTWESTDPDNSANPGDYRWTASGTR